MNKLIKLYNIKRCNLKISVLILSILVSLMLFGCDMIIPTSNNTNDNDPVVIVDGELAVHFIDVGQADAILIQQKNQAMLIDAGNNGDGDLVTDYIKKLGISKLDYVIGTHPHEDHIGGLDIVIDSFDIGEVFLPKASSNTKTFEAVLNSIRNKGLKIKEPIVGMKFNVGDSENIILAPNSKEYSNTNEYSIIIKLTFGNNSFIFTGDAEEHSEEEVIENGLDLSADVLKLGHHGSRSSTSDEFLKEVNPSIAIVSAGEGNKYGHPHEETLDKLKHKNIKVYRTDEIGTIILTSDGKTITVNGDEKITTSDDEGNNDDNSKGKTDDESNNKLSIVSYTEVVENGAEATLTAKGSPEKEYDITVYYSSGPSSSKDLDPKIANSEGNITWTWKVGSQTKPGTYKIVIEGNEEKIEIQFEVK